MKKTIFITGASTGIGKETVFYFAQKGWNVAATMRNVANGAEICTLPNVRLYDLDVTDEESIKKTIKLAISDFGKIDVIVNNAGFGAIGIFEKATPEQVKKQFDTNVFGMMNVIRCILPHFRENKSGTIINISSIAGFLSFPLYSLYNSSKWAVEGFSEGLQYELRPFNIKVKCVEPGPIKTDFYTRSQELFKSTQLSDYDNYENIAYKSSQTTGEKGIPAIKVAKVIFKAANSSCNRLRYPVNFEAASYIWMKRYLPNWLVFRIIRMVIE